MVASWWLSGKALAVLSAVAAASAIFAAAILSDQIGLHWKPGEPGRWPTEDQAAILAQFGRWLLTGVVVLVGFLALRRGVWLEAILGATAILAAIVLVMAAKDQLDGQFAKPVDPVKAPTLTLRLHEAELVGPMPSPSTGVQLIVVTPQRDAEGNVTDQKTKATAGRIGIDGCQASASAANEAASSSNLGVVLVDCSIEISRGEDDASLLDLLGRIIPDSHVVIAPR
ncbi:MAG: hypothetical protein ABJC24_00170 [Chloroflexota bacterium]